MLTRGVVSPPKLKACCCSDSETVLGTGIWLPRLILQVLGILVWLKAEFESIIL